VRFGKESRWYAHNVGVSFGIEVVEVSVPKRQTPLVHTKINAHFSHGIAPTFAGYWSMHDNVSDHPERRRYPRIKAKVPVELLCPGAAPMRTITDEISLCGCYIETMFTMEVGTKLVVVLSVKDQKIQAQGVVVTKYPQVGNGIDFVELNHDESRKLSEFIAEHQH